MRFSILRLLITTALVAGWIGLTVWLVPYVAPHHDKLTPLDIFFSAFFALLSVIATGAAIVGVWLVAGEIESQIKQTDDSDD